MFFHWNHLLFINVRFNASSEAAPDTRPSKVALINQHGRHIKNRTPSACAFVSTHHRLKMISADLTFPPTSSQKKQKSLQSINELKAARQKKLSRNKGQVTWSHLSRLVILRPSEHPIDLIYLPFRLNLIKSSKQPSQTARYQLGIWNLTSWRFTLLPKWYNGNNSKRSLWRWWGGKRLTYK